MNRNQFFNINGKNTTVPFIKLNEKSTDKKIVYKEGVDRLDKLSDYYYNNPTFGWLILLANPEHGGLEFNIPDQSIIRIPLPLEETLTEYNRKVKESL